MLFSRSWTLAVAVGLPLVAATIDNSDASDALTAAAVTLTAGDYVFTNVASGQTISYVEDDRQFFPSDGAGSSIQMTVNPSGPYMRIAAGGKCLSAQWGYNEAGQGVGADHAGVLYTCAVGEDADPDSTVEKTKQWWLLVPVSANSTTSNLDSDSYLETSGDSSDSSSNSTSTNSTSSDDCQKSAAWVQRHPLYVKGPKYHHTECASLLRNDQRKSLGLTNLSRRARHQHVNERLSRRTSQDSDLNGGTYYIIALDHLLDMPTRALSGSVSLIEGAKSTELELYAEGTALQQWTLSNAS